MQVLSISGRDRVGKSEQINLLKGYGRFNHTGHLIDYGNRWPKLSPVEVFNWWFRDVPFLELVSIILESLVIRRATYIIDKININDRGSLMFKAVCAATLHTRENISAEKIVAIIDRLFEKEIQESRFEQEILLRADSEYMVKVGYLTRVVDVRETSYLPWQEEMYARYQASLAYFINHYYQGLCPENMIGVDSCILDTHGKLLRVLNGMYGTDLLPVCSTLETLVAFGGLSECGKSSFAEQLSTHHQFYRLKIKYFGEVVRSRGLQLKSATLGREILDFLRCHKHVTRASIESLHGVDLPAYLKLLFGARLRIAYLDTPEEVRVRRTAQELGISFEEARVKTSIKDSAKLSCGANKVKDIADVVFSNEQDGFDVAFSAFVDQI